MNDPTSRDNHSTQNGVFSHEIPIISTCRFVTNGGLIYIFITGQLHNDYVFDIPYVVYCYCKVI